MISFFPHIRCLFNDNYPHACCCIDDGASTFFTGLFFLLLFWGVRHCSPRNKAKWDELICEIEKWVMIKTCARHKFNHLTSQIDQRSSSLVSTADLATSSLCTDKIQINWFCALCSWLFIQVSDSIIRITFRICRETENLHDSFYYSNWEQWLSCMHAEKLYVEQLG